MSLVLVLNEEEVVALVKILAACEDAFDEGDERDASVMASVRLVRDRLDAAVADKAMQTEIDERWERMRIREGLKRRRLDR